MQLLITSKINLWGRNLEWECILRRYSLLLKTTLNPETSSLMSVFFWDITSECWPDVTNIQNEIAQFTYVLEILKPC